jgi:glycosyltransferase involved in cell wall biosynthesis
VNGSTKYSGAVVVIPTRNRAELAMNAIRSVLGQPVVDVRLVVSDNSTSDLERSALAAFCERLDDPRVRYIVPPQPLPTSPHWNWAMQQALSLGDCSHFAFLTDRMMFKPDALKPLIEIITKYPDRILSYMHDMVDDFSSPVVLHQYTWTGNLYEVSSAHLLGLSAESVMYDSCIPRMLNCIAPRAVLNAIYERFGSIFASIAPDWNFCYRALDTVDSMLFYDKAALVHYAQQRSNGQSVHHGVANESFVNFTKELGATPLNFAAPFPEIVTVWNVIINEYCYTKQVTQSRRFPELNLDKYVQALAVGIDSIKDPDRQQYMRELLSARASKLPKAPSTPLPAPPVEADEKQAPHVEGFSINDIEFQSSEDALDYALRYPRERAAASDHETLIRGVAVALPEAISAPIAHC